MSYADYKKVLDEVLAQKSASSGFASSVVPSIAKSSITSSNNIPVYRQTAAQRAVLDPIGTSRARVSSRISGRTTVGKKKDEDDKKVDFFKKGAFDDGYQMWDITKTILGTAGDAGLNLVKGAGSLVEGVGDLISYGAAGAADALDEDEWADHVRKRAQENRIEEWTQGLTDYFDKNSVLAKTSDSILQGLGQVGGIMATGGLGAAAGLSGAGVTALTTGVMGLSGMGSGMGEAYEAGATDEEAVKYGVISGAADALTELVFGGLGKTVNALGFSKGLSSADDMLAKAVSDKFKNQIAKNITQFGVKAGAEGLEEVMAGFLQAAGKKATYMSEKDFKEILEDENLMEQFIVGSMTSGMIQSGLVPGTKKGSLVEANKTGSDFLTGLSKNETAVVKKEVENRIAEIEKKGEKLTAKQKSNLEAEVIRDMEKGRISTSTIEEVLGGDSAAVSELVKGDRLSESYNEVARRTQLFEADLTQYDVKQQEVVKRAIESGVLNNTNRSHEFVDIIAKISADKGVPFDFTNNAKLKESGFAVEGATVDGFVNENGITINMQSPKAWQTTVGHEVTHVLEGTEFYTELQNVLFEYAKPKGDYLSRFNTLKERYKDVYKDITPEEYEAKINAEVTADLVGEYLFTDENFVNNLTANKNVFQKIYDEIKYLCKVVTAGSKEARDIERIKKAFDKAYKEATWDKTDTMYSISNNNIKEVSTGYSYGETFFTMSYEQDGKVVGTIDYGEFEGEPNVKMIEVDPEYRRQGIGTKLLQELQKKYSETEINFGMSTPDGSKLLEKATYSVENTEVSEKLARIEEIKQKLSEYDEGYENFFENDLEIPENYADDYNDLYDEMRDLQKEVMGKKTTKTFVKTDSDVKYSLSVDSDGRTLSETQEKRFKDSKVRDENGNLKVVYHGSPADFNTFSLAYLGTNGTAEGYGFYFTDKKSIAEGYSKGHEGQQNGNPGKLFEVYLDIKKPLSDTEVTMTRAQFKKFLTELNNHVDEDGERLDVLSNYGDVEWEGLNKVLNYAMEIEYDGSDSDVNLVHSIINCCGDMKTVFDVLRKTTGYDGIIVEEASWGGDQTIYITFHPEQIKNVDNLNPTDDPDTRYSLSDKVTNPNGFSNPASDLMYAPAEENATVSETENVGPVVETPKAFSISETLEELEEERQSLEDTLHSLVADEDFGDKFKELSAKWSEVNKKIEAMEQAQKPKQETKKPLTTTEKAQKHYRDDVLSKLVNTGDAELKAIEQATADAQKLISEGTDGVKSITEIFGKISTDGNLTKFEDYLRHLLNVDRSTLSDRFGIENRKVWDFTAEESQKEADRLAEEHPEFKKAAEDVYAFNDYVMSLLVKSGKNTQEQADTWKEYYPHYVPISRSRHGNVQDYSLLLEFLQGETNEDSLIQSLDDFSLEADKSADIYKITSSGDDFNPLIDTMVNRAFVAHWAVAISQNPAIAPVSETVQVDGVAPIPVAEESQTNVEPETMTIEVEESASEPSPQRREDLMDNTMSIKKITDEYLLDNGYVFEKIDRKIGSRNLEAYWHHIRNASSIAQHIMGNGVNGSRSLNDIVDEVESSGLTFEFYSYMGHLRNIDGMTMQARYGVAANRNFMGRDITAARSMAEVRKLESEHPEFKKWAQDCYTYTDSILKQYVEHGVISQDDFVLLKELYPHYVPMRTEKGAVKPMFETLAQFTTEAQNAMAFNDFGVELENTLHTEVGRDLMNIDSFIGRIDSGDNLFTFGENGDFHTLTVYQNGELKTFDITKEMYMAMKPSASWLNWKIPVLSQASEFFRKSTTEYNLWFAMKNGVRDPQDIIYNSQHPAQTYANLAESVKQITTQGEYYQEYIANGGEPNVYYNPKNKTFDPDKGVTDYLKKITGLEAVSTVNNRIETIPRLAEYIASREAGASVQEAMLDSARVTTNFAAGGKFTKFLNRNGCTFLNASVQGALQHHRNIQEAKVNGLKAVASLAARYVATGLTASMLNKLIWDDDEDYQKLPDYISNNYYIVGKYGDGQFVRIPKGRTNVVIENAIKQVAKQSNGNDQADWEQFWDLFIENLAPNNPATDNIFAPIIEVATNTSWYGEDIIPYRLKDLPASEQFDEKTDSLSVWLGEKLDYSPKKINYLINSYTGVIGDTFLPLGTPKAESPSDSIFGKVTAPLRDIFTTDSVLNNRVTGDFYETLEAAEAQAESENATMDDKFRSSILIGYNAEISKLMQEQRDIQTSDLKDSEKYKRNREIKEEINALQKKGLEALEDARIYGVYAEDGDKRYNYDSEDDTWWEVKPTLADGRDNYYYQQEQRITKDLAISYKEYWNNREMYDDFYYVAGGYDKDSSADDTIETARTIFGYERFAEYARELKNIKADKDENGEPISGSKYPKVQAYVNSLDIPDIEKKILYKMQYPNYNRYSYEIVKYLDENDNVSYDSFYKILDELGYKVDSKGYVTWW